MAHRKAGSSQRGGGGAVDFLVPSVLSTLPFPHLFGATTA